MHRFSVLYTLKEQYHHLGYSTRTEAETALQRLQADSMRKPVGIYDAKTELFDWEPTQQSVYEQADIEEQGKLGVKIINTVQALRRRDASWQPGSGFRRPTFFA